MDIEFRVNADDFTAFRASVKRHARPPAWVFVRSLLIGIFAGVLVVTALQSIFDFTQMQSRPLRALAFTLLLVVTAGAYLAARFTSWWWPQPTRSFSQSESPKTSSNRSL